MLRATCFVLLISTITFSSTSTAQDYALKLNAGEEYVAGNNSHLPQGNSPRTLEAWVNSNSDSIQTIFNYGNVIPNERMGILLHSGRLYVVGQYSDIHGFINIPKNSWTHVAATYDGSTVKLYVNGVLDRDTPFPAGSHNATGTQWRIGMGNDTAPGQLFEPFTGLIDEVRVWNVARSATEIANSMNGCVSGNEASLVANYRLDDGPNSATASDHSASNATGVLVNIDTSQSWVSPGAVSCSDTFTVGGTVSDLAGSGLVLQNNGGDNLPINANGSFTFTTPQSDASPYDVRVLTQPTGPVQFCTVSNGTGTLSGADVTNVMVRCDRLQIVDLTCVAGKDCYLNRQGQNGAVLPSVGPNYLFYRPSVERSQIAADGTTLLLLRARSDVPVTFHLKDALGIEVAEETPCLLGKLMTRNGQNGSCRSVVVQPEDTTFDGKWVFAIYQAPTNYPPDVGGLLSGGESKVKIALNSGTSQGERTIVIKRVPVALIHGVWSSKEAWRTEFVEAPGSTFESSLKLAGFDVHLIEHKDIDKSAGSFSPMGSAVLDRIHNSVATILDNVRAEGTAVSRVDIVGHSMGGLIARAYAANKVKKNPYKDLRNYDAGYFHKVITIGTPHRGTPAANFLISNKCATRTVCTKVPNLPINVCASGSLEQLFNKIEMPLGPAILGFQVGSAELEGIGVSEVKGHSIFTTAPDSSETEFILNALFKLFSLNSAIDDQLGGNGTHDTIVPTSSQNAGSTGPATAVYPGIVHANMAKLGTDINQTASVDTFERTEEILKAPIQSTKFAGFSAHNGEDPMPPEDCTLSSVEVPESTQANSDASISISPSPGTIAEPGDTVQITFTIENGSPLSSALFSIAGLLQEIEGGSPYILNYTVPSNIAGRIDIHVETLGPGPENYAADTYIIAKPQTVPESLTINPPSIILEGVGSTIPLSVLAHYEGGAEVDVTETDSGTAYSALLGTSIISVTDEGVVVAEGVGLETITVMHNGISAQVQVEVVPFEQVFNNGFE